MNEASIHELRRTVQQFIRLFGLLEQTRTPRGFNLSLSQVFALQELEGHTRTLTELSELLQLDRSSVSRLIDALVKGGFVTRLTNEHNRREVLLSLSGKGENAVATVRQQSLRFYQRILEQMSTDDQARFQQGITQFTAALASVRSPSQ